jgi:hypothetical protein
MRVFKLSLIFFIAALFITACNRSQLEQSYDDNYQLGRAGAGFGYDDDTRWARENLDLQAVGELLQKADDAEEFEYLLNSDENGVNNLDLNGDGYADYISVREFDDRYDDERGFSLFSMFGPDEIQEICTIIFDRDRYNDYDGGYYPGARVLLTGNEQIYGDNYYYESNWLDRSLPIVSWLFTDRNDYYRSPYYYENYPSYYEPYQVVETTVYQTRIDQYYPAPVFIQTTQPSITEVRIESPYREKSMDKVYSKLAKPTKEQVEFKKSNPKPPEFVRANKENRVKSFSGREDKQVRDNPNKQFKDNPNRFERQEKVRIDRPQMREKPNRQERINVQPQNQPRFERPNQQRFERQNQPRFERQNQPRFERQSQPRIERQNQPRIERQNQPQRQEMRPQRQENRVQPNNGGGNPNKGGGNPNKGGGNGNGGGGGKKGKG